MSFVLDTQEGGDLVAAGDRGSETIVSDGVKVPSTPTISTGDEDGGIRRNPPQDENGAPFYGFFC